MFSVFKQRRGVEIFFYFMFLSAFILSSRVNLLASPDDVLATYDGGRLTRGDVEGELARVASVPQGETIARQYQTKEGRESFIRQFADVLMLQLYFDKAGFAARPEYKAAVKDLFASQVVQVSVSEKMKQAIPSEAQIKEYYEQNKEDFVAPDRYNYQDIALDTEAEAKKIKKEIDSGKSFLALAKTHSISKTADSAGDKGYVPADQIDSQILANLMSLSNGEVSNPIKLDDNLHVIVKLIGKMEGKQQTLQESRNTIERILAPELQKQVLSTFIEKTLKEASCEIMNAEILAKSELTDKDKEAVLCTYKLNGKKESIPIAPLLAQLEQIPPMIRPQIMHGQALGDLVNQYVFAMISAKNVSENIDAYKAKHPVLYGNVETQLKVQMVMQEVADKATVSPQELEAYYAQNLIQFTQPEVLNASHILVEDEKEAQKHLAVLKKNPEKFAEIAGAVSKCPSGKQGGDLGEFTPETMVREFSEAALKAEKGAIVGPVKTQFGYHIIRLNDKKPASLIPLEEVREQLEMHLIQGKQAEAVENFIVQMEKDFNFKIHTEKL